MLGLKRIIFYVQFINKSMNARSLIDLSLSITALSLSHTLSVPTNISLPPSLTLSHSFVRPQSYAGPSERRTALNSTSSPTSGPLSLSLSLSLTHPPPVLFSTLRRDISAAVSLAPFATPHSSRHAFQNAIAYSTEQGRVRAGRRKRTLVAKREERSDNNSFDLTAREEGYDVKTIFRQINFEFFESCYTTQKKH